MVIRETTWHHGAERQKSYVLADIVVRNRFDEGCAESGEIAMDAVRSVTLRRVLVDTGATMLSLPASVIAHLGLSLMREVTIRTAAGLAQARIFQDAKLIVDGRPGNFECLELPDDAQPLLGVLPLESLGIEPDIVNHRLRLLPEGPGDTHYLLM